MTRAIPIAFVVGSLIAADVNGQKKGGPSIDQPAS
jgi:hypothetical protein